MIKIYKNYINEKNNSKHTKLRTNMDKNKNTIPLILVIDDVQMSDKY